MARPKKTSSEDLLAIVDSFFTTEASGNPAKLKCSLLEEYAARIGKEAKAYDFRRDEKVRLRIDELKALVQNENGMGIQLGNPYKSLDVDRIMKARQDPDALRTALGELDSYWKYVYESTLQLRQEAESKATEMKKLEEKCDSFEQENIALRKNNAAVRSEARGLMTENRYLRKMLRTYLYPALANEILKEENQLKNPDTEVTPQAKEKMIDGKFPSSVSAALSDDRKVLSREEELLQMMWDSIPE
ncbi:MAG: hypothetical protein IKH57_17405 [Clostridia bacterium]|nr:hypothetical protein [Eubacterium sp.]MBR3018831.1 hypothetical protein [Clostridia bacterium]